MSTTEKKTPPSKSTKMATPEGDPAAPPGTPEHLGSDRPYEGQPPDEAQNK